MQVPRHSIFRDKALKHYAQGRKKDILPHFSSVPVAIFFWVLVGSLVATGLLATSVQIPMYLNGSGIVLSAESEAFIGSDKAVAIAFFQPGTSAQLHIGQPVKVQVGAEKAPIASAVIEIEAGTISPEVAMGRYGMQAEASSLSNKPAVIVFVSLGANFPVALYAGTALALEVNVGTQSLFSTLAGAGNSTGE